MEWGIFECHPLWWGAILGYHPAHPGNPVPSILVVLTSESAPSYKIGLQAHLEDFLLWDEALRARAFHTLVIA